jgi:dihydrofolate reductase
MGKPTRGRFERRLGAQVRRDSEDRFLPHALRIAVGKYMLAKGELEQEVSRLKEADGGDIIAYGGGTFVSDLIRQNLIDEYNFFINPAAISEGMTIFR